MTGTIDHSGVNCCVCRQAVTWAQLDSGHARYFIGFRVRKDGERKPIPDGVHRKCETVVQRQIERQAVRTEAA